jgi:CubicO group peptidase (beta-lactamase class C family)
MTPDEWIKKLGALPLKADPGATWMYNTSSDVMAVLVARASRMPFDQFLDRRIFGPLKMKDTAFWVPPDKRSRLAKAYTIDAGTGKLTPMSASSSRVEGDRPPLFLSGAGGLVSTATDYLAFARMMLHGGELDGVRIMSPVSIRAMTQNYLPPDEHRRFSPLPADVVSYPDRGFGYGVSVITTAYGLGPAEGSYGWPGASGVWWQADPKNNMICIVLDQLYGSTKYKVQQDLTSMMYQSLVEPGQ